MSEQRSQIHMLSVAAARLESDHANPKLVADLRAAAKLLSEARAAGRGWTDEDEKRVARQRNLFTMLPDTRATDQLKEAMLQRCYDLMWDGNCIGCDALAEFLPESDVTRMFNAWENDQDGNNTRTAFYEGRT